MATNTKTVTPCKKYNGVLRIKNEIKRALAKTDVWVHNTPASLLKRFRKDVEEKRLPVRGTPFEEITFNLIDVASLFSAFDMSIHSPHLGKKLRDTPLFANAKTIDLEKETEVETYQHYTHKGGYEEYLENYKAQHGRFLSRQKHKMGFSFSYDIWSTYILAIDITLEFLRENSIHKLCDYLKKKFSSYELRRADPVGLYAFILHLAIRGICKPTTMQILSGWKNAWNLRTVHERNGLLNQWYGGLRTASVIAMQESYITEMLERSSLLRHESRLVRISYIPDKTLFNSKYVCFASWYNGVHEQMSSVDKHRSALGLKLNTGFEANVNMEHHICYKFKGQKKCDYCSLCSNTFEAEPTMNMFESSIANGIESSLPAIKDAAKSIISDPENLESLRKAAVEAAIPVVDELATKMEQLKDKTVEELKASVDPVLNESFGTFSSLNQILSFLKETMNSIIKMIPTDLLSSVGINIDFATLFNVFKYYIVYINIDSTLLKGMLVLLMLKEIGVYELLVKYGVTLMAWMKSFKIGDNEVVVDSTAIKAEPTGCFAWANTIMNMLMGQMPAVAICTFITLGLSLLFKIALSPQSTKFNKNEHASIYTTILDGCKNMHFLGAGLFGMERIVKYVTLIGSTLSKWVSHYIMGNPSDDYANERKVAVWYAKLQYFKTEAGRTAIRVSDETLVEAEKIQPDGLAMIAALASDPKFISRESSLMLQRCQKDAAELASFCFRIRAMSNFKPAMFHIQFVGKPGIGKSQLTEALINKLADEIYAPDVKRSHYSYNPNVEYFDGYQGQKFMIIDDLFRFNEPKHMSLLIGLVTNTPVLLPMAHLEEKGIQLESDVLISSTNTPYPEAKDVYCMDAVHRRRHVLIEVLADPDVMDSATSQFSKLKFEQKYPNQNSRDFPHLTFNLLKPVVAAAESNILQTSHNEQKELLAKLKRIKTINNTLVYNEDDYFTTRSSIPDGFSFPCKNLKFEQLIKQISGRYSALRSSENKMSIKDKYSQVMDCFSEIDHLFRQIDILDSRVELDTKMLLISNQFLNATYAYGIDDPLGKKIYLNEGDVEIADIPEVASIKDIEKQLGELLADPAEPTGETDSFVSAHSDEKLDYIEIIDDYLENREPRGLEREQAMSLRRILLTSPLEDLSDEERVTFDNIMESIIEQPTFHEIAEERIAEKFRKHTLRESIKKYEYDNPITEHRDFDWRTIRGDQRFTMRVSEIYELEKEECNMKFTKSCAKTQADTLFPPLMCPFAFTHGLILKDRLKAYKESGTIDAKKMYAIEKFMNELENDACRVIIPKSKVFPERLHGRITTIPKSWLKRMVQVRGEWHIDVTDLYYGDGALFPSTSSESNHEIVNLLLSLTPFTMAMQEFAMFNSEQQKFLVKHTWWMTRYLPEISMGTWKNTLLKIVDSIKNGFMAYIYNPLKYYWGVLSKYTTNFIPLINHLLGFVLGIVVIKRVGRLFSGSQEPTSKVMHRVNTKSVSFRSKHIGPTGYFENSKLTDAALAQQYLDRNVRYIILSDDMGFHIKCHAIHTEQFLIINHHIAEQITGECEIDFCPTPRHSDRWSFRIGPENVYSLPKADAAIIFCRQFPMAKNINKHFMTNADYEALDTSVEMWSLSRYEEESAIEIRSNGVPYTDMSLKNDKTNASAFLAKALMVPGTTIVGKSGAMLMIPAKASGNRNILGIQAWRIHSQLNPQIIYQIITQENLQYMIEEVTKKSKYPYIQQEGPLVLEPTSTPKVANLIEHHVEVEGSVPADKIVGRVSKTAFRKTKIAHLMDRDGYTSARVPAALNSYDERLNVKVHPLKNSLNKCGRGIVGPFDRDLLEKASQDVAYWIKEHLDKDKFDTHLNFETIVTGLREPGSNPIDCRASPGLPYVWDKYPGKPKGKKSLIEINEDGHAIINDPDYPNQFEKFYAKLQKGIIPKHTSYDFPKDELRPYAKALGDIDNNTPPKTRSVTCMSLDIILSWRRVSLDLFSALHRLAQGNFPFAPGMNPEGPHWGNLFHYLNKFSNVVDFDVSNWDGHMTSDLLMAAGDAIVIMLGVKPNSPEAKVIYSIITEVVFGHVQFEDMVYHKLRGLISGFPGTAEVNTLAHFILFYYFYLRIVYSKSLWQYANIYSFVENCHSIFYGDDVQASISDEIIEWFNALTIAEQYELHGYPVTDAAKGGVLQPSKSILESQFLKSGFNIVNSFRVDRKLDLSVCFDMFYWVRAKEHPEEQFLSNVHDAFRVMHGHGEETYEEVRAMFNCWMREVGMKPFVIRWKDFELLHVKNYYE